MGRTTIARALIEEIKLGKADKDEVLRQLADPAGTAEAKRRGPPAVTVTFHTLREPGRPPPASADLARGTLAYEWAPVYDVSATASLYVLDDPTRVDVLRFGRHPSQDVQLLDRIVSREHGLVIYAGGLPLFCDYGTLKDGVHAGSRNGTFIDGLAPIRDTMISWLPSHALMLGTLTHDRYGQRCFATMITYELHVAAPAFDN